MTAQAKLFESLLAMQAEHRLTRDVPVCPRRRLIRQAESDNPSLGADIRALRHEGNDVPTIALMLRVPVSYVQKRLAAAPEPGAEPGEL